MAADRRLPALDALAALTQHRSGDFAAENKPEDVEGEFALLELSRHVIARPADPAEHVVALVSDRRGELASRDGLAAPGAPAPRSQRRTAPPRGSPDALTKAGPRMQMKIKSPAVAGQVQDFGEMLDGSRLCAG